MSRIDSVCKSTLLTACLDARGHYTIGKELVDNVIDRIRRVAGSLFRPYSGIRLLTRNQTTALPSRVS
jgi:hypothetical protein